MCGFTRTICARAGVPKGMRWPNASTTADTSREAWSRPLPVLTTALLRPMIVGSRLPGWVAARASRESRAPADPGPAWNWARLTRASGGRNVRVRHQTQDAGTGRVRWSHQALAAADDQGMGGAATPQGQAALMIAETNSSTQIAHGTGTLFTHWPVSVVVRGKYFPL